MLEQDSLAKKLAAEIEVINASRKFLLLTMRLQDQIYLQCNKKLQPTKTKARSLIENLNDPNNPSLRLRIRNKCDSIRRDRY